VAAHSCVLSYWQAVKHESALPSWGRYRTEVTRGLEAADLIVAPSQAMLSSVLQHYCITGPVQVIHNARDPSLFHAAPSKRPFILSVGRRWDEAKNVAMLERVAGRLPWPVYIAGEEKLAGAGGTHEPREGLRPLGRLSEDQMITWMARAGVYCLPARYEPFGLSILEAALSGCTLVLGDIPSLRELWHGAAMFVMPEDAEQLEWTLKAIIDDVPLRKTLAHYAQQRGREFSPARVAALYMSAYQRLIDRQNRLERGLAEPRGIVITDQPVFGAE
jgi:glycosyltransferase involved in cell wall biosynthesis